VTPFGAALDRFLFRPADARTAAVFRIALAAMLAWVFWPAGWDPAGVRHVPGPDALYRDVFLTRPYWLAVLALLVLFAAGVRPRIVGPAAALLLAPLMFRAGRLPGRLVMEFTLVAFSFLRSDAVLSARRLPRLASRRPRAPAVRAGAAPDAGPIWPVRLVQLQLSVLYGVNALAKSTPEFLSGDVLMAQSFTLANFRADFTDGALTVGPLEVPVWAAGTAAALTEAALAIGFWIPRLRVPTALLGAAFHGALTSIVQIGFLDWVSLFLYSAFLLPFTTSVPAASGLRPPVPPPSRAGARAVSGDGDAGNAAPLPDSGIIPI
jgi:hypothetical protein